MTSMKRSDVRTITNLVQVSCVRGLEVQRENYSEYSEVDKRDGSPADEEQNLCGGCGRLEWLSIEAL